MSLATYKCGCPVPPAIIKPVGVQAPCSLCCPRPPSKTESKSEGVSVSQDAKAIGTDRIVSEIVKKGLPYKEIEAVINDNRVIVRMHKEPVKVEYDPPCECIGQPADDKGSSLSLTKRDDGVAFDMTEGSLELHRVPREAASSTEKTCEETGCRTVTLYPQADGGDPPTSRARRSRDKRPIELEENPNLFVLRIRRYSDNSDKKQKIDLEFRAPRPWRPREDKKLREHLEEPEEMKSAEEHDRLEGNEILEEQEVNNYERNNQFGSAM